METGFSKQQGECTMNVKRILSKAVAIILVVAALAATATQGMAQQPARGMSGRMNQPGKNNFTTLLYSGEVQKFNLGPSDKRGGYVVDVTPLEDSTDGAYFEKWILPEYDGEKWVDMLTLLLPADAPPLQVNVQIYSTKDWPQVFRDTLSLDPGAWQGYMVQPSSVAGGYVIEINPRGRGDIGDRIERAMMQPEVPDGSWWDVLRLQIPEDQAPMQAEVIVYQTPADLPVVMESEFVAEAGVWYGMGVGDSQDGGAYVIEITPLGSEPGQIERYTVQPEFDGVSWNDVARVMVTPDWPPMALRVTVYQVGGN
jgi:hypothetical protein